MSPSVSDTPGTIRTVETDRDAEDFLENHRGGGGFTRLEQWAALVDQGLKFGSTVWRCFDGRGITLKKDSACE
jgi:hypothetical protein